jgi:hypothetical protein
MKKNIFLAALLCMLVTTNQVSAQLIIRNNGHAEIGHDPYDPVPEGLNPSYYNYLDTVTALKVFGNRDGGSGGHMTFGDNLLWNLYNVVVGELGYQDSDRLWLQGKKGTYLTVNNTASDTIMYYDPYRSTAVQFNYDVHTSGVFVQSDERFKEQVEPVEGVLPSLESLQAVSYILKNENAAKCKEQLSSMPVLTEKDSKDKAFFDQYYSNLEKGSERYGFLAQNVKEVFPELVHTDNAGYMYVDYIGLIPILVQSINELRAELEEVKAEKQELESAAATTPAFNAPQQTAQDEISASLTEAVLYQNAPNPWSSETVIRYRLPQSVTRADIYIYDMQGAQLKSIPAHGRGESQVTLTAHDLKAGMYLYALVADGTLVDSKQMILTK